jgi:MFS family permease
MGSATAAVGGTDGQRRTTWLGAMGRSLAHRNFRLFFLGQGISVIGTWMQQMATIWLVYRLSHSSLWLGLVGFAGQVPAALVTPLAGVLVDRWDRRRTVLAAQALMMLEAAALLVLTLTGVVAVWQIVLLSAAIGVVNAFDMIARQSFVIEMVERPEDLPNAIALNSSTYNGARLIGPALAGFVIGLWGEWPCFLLNALSYLAVLASLLAMRVPRSAKRLAGQRILAGFREGLGYVARSLPIRSVLVLLGVVNMMAMPLVLLMPLVGEVLDGGPETVGLLTSALGCGALAASLALAARRSVVGLSRVIALAAGVFGLGMMGLALSHTLWLSLAALAVTGAAMVTEMAASNTLLQAIVEDDKRGRVMSFQTLAFVGTAPLGCLLSGCLAAHIGSMATIFRSGLVCLAGSLVFAAMLPAVRRAIHPIYIRVGILRAPAAETAAVATAPSPAERHTLAFPSQPAVPAARRSAA